MTHTTLFILGCGFLGAETARIALERGQRVIGTLRNVENEEKLRALGSANAKIELVTSPSIDRRWLDAALRAVDGAAQVLVTYPPDPATDDALANVCAKHGARVVYISSTAVFGEVRGRVDQTTPAQPNEARGQRRLDAENTWSIANAMVLRAPAIYGPGRGLHLRIARGEHQLPESGDNFVSRIHVHDLARLSLAALSHGEAKTRYVIGDLRPCPQREITEWLCRRMQKPMAAATTLANVSPTLRNDRQVDPTWALSQLAITLAFPTYIEGYEDCMQRDALSL